MRDSTKAAIAAAAAAAPGSSKKQKFIFFPYLQKLFSKSCRQMAREIKAPHNNKTKNNSKLS